MSSTSKIAKEDDQNDLDNPSQQAEVDSSALEQS